MQKTERVKVEIN